MNSKKVKLLCKKDFIMADKKTRRFTKGKTYIGKLYSDGGATITNDGGFDHLMDFENILGYFTEVDESTLPDNVVRILKQEKELLEKDMDVIIKNLERYKDLVSYGEKELEIKRLELENVIKVLEG